MQYFIFFIPKIFLQNKSFLKKFSFQHRLSNASSHALVLRSFLIIFLLIFFFFFHRLKSLFIALSLSLFARQIHQRRQNWEMQGFIAPSGVLKSSKKKSISCITYKFLLLSNAALQTRVESKQLLEDLKIFLTDLLNLFLFSSPAIFLNHRLHILRLMYSGTILPSSHQHREYSSKILTFYIR